METWEWILVGAAGAASLLLAAGLVRIRRRRAHLQERFGSEYDRTVASRGRGAGEKQLAEVEERHDELDVRALPAATRERYLEEWRLAEARFVNDPRDAARTAERVVMRVLTDRGYELDAGEDDVEQRVALIAVDHPAAAERFRHGHAMFGHVGRAESTESLRRAMMDFRAVLDELLETEPAAALHR